MEPQNSSSDAFSPAGGQDERDRMKWSSSAFGGGTRTRTRTHVSQSVRRSNAQHQHLYLVLSFLFLFLGSHDKCRTVENVISHNRPVVTPQSPSSSTIIIVSSLHTRRIQLYWHISVYEFIFQWNPKRFWTLRPISIGLVYGLSTLSHNINIFRSKAQKTGLEDLKVETLYEATYFTLKHQKFKLN